MNHRQVILVLFFVLNLWGSVYAQSPDPAQTSGGVTRQEQDIDRLRRLEERLQQDAAEFPIQIKGEQPPQPRGPKVLVNEIRVEGAHLLSEEDISVIVAPYQGRGLTMQDMQEVADHLTDAYRKKGYITSRAYIPVQSVKDKVLTINVLEAKSGNVDIRGNRYFKEKQLRKTLNAGPSGYFDFSALQQSLVYINEHPDRKAKAVLVPGAVPGTTDVIIEMAERRPFHAGFEYDNYGSRYIEENRYSLILEHNNLTQHDDLLYIKGQISDDSRLIMQQLRYVYPINQKWDLGMYAFNSLIKLGKEFDALEAEGDAQVFGVFASHRLIRQENVDLRLNLGFDYKSIRNKILGEQLSKDELRVVKAGFDLDFEDPWGRNILTAGIDSGLADFWGSSDKKDPEASRTGAGGRFDKGNFTYFRLQPMVYETSLLWKNIAQFTNHNLTASEQFQIGGALSVRGYPPAEHSGDSGIYSAMELSVPIYPLSRDVMVPFTRTERLYDALRFVVFYDIATAHLNNPLAGEEDYETLRGYGFGMRLNVLDNLTFRVEVGFPHGKDPSDGDNVHPWIEFTSIF